MNKHFWRILSQQLTAQGDELSNTKGLSKLVEQRKKYTAEFCYTLAEAIKVSLREYEKKKKSLKNKEYADKHRNARIRLANIMLRIEREECRAYWKIPAYKKIPRMTLLAFRKMKAKQALAANPPPDHRKEEEEDAG